MKTKLYQRIARTLEAITNCDRAGNTEWMARHGETLNALCAAHYPSGSGFDNGTVLAPMPESTPQRLVFRTSYHHMNDTGAYDGWTEHDVIVTPNLAHGFDVRVTGRDRHGIKEYIAEVFYEMLSAEVES